MAANQLAPQADLVIGIGTRLTDFTTGSKALFSHPDVEFLLLNVAEFDALKLDATALIADAQTGLEALTHALGDYRSGWGEAIAEAKSAWRDECRRLWDRQWRPDDAPEVAGHLDAQLAEYGETLNTRLTQTRVLGLINQHVEDNAIVVGAAGSLPGIYSASGRSKRRTAITWSTATPAWATRLRRPSARSSPDPSSRCTPWWGMAPT
jgi:3D-(3,5/4)-trihydroxycyclohexane-1,2-dione acylhydrolase (decyclizing)